MDTQIGYEQLLYTVWTVNYSNPIPSGYAQNRIWAEGLNEAELALFIHSCATPTPSPNSILLFLSVVLHCMLTWLIFELLKKSTSSWMKNISILGKKQSEYNWNTSLHWTFTH